MYNIGQNMSDIEPVGEIPSENNSDNYSTITLRQLMKDGFHIERIEYGHVFEHNGYFFIVDKDRNVFDAKHIDLGFTTKSYVKSK